MTAEFELRGVTGVIEGVAGWAAAGVAAAGAGAFAGLGDAAACPQAIPEISNIVDSTRIRHLAKLQPEYSSPKLTTVLAARMRACVRQVIRGATAVLQELEQGIAMRNGLF